ncbi:MAG: CinA family protein, partial [Prevotella sp.]|nr:CinA family protein [Prevotella sp.]
EMVKGVLNLLGTDFAIATTGFAGPGADAGIPVGTIWIACGTADDIRTLKIEGDEGREENLRNATTKALHFFVEFLKELYPEPADMDQVPKPEAK